MQAQLAQASCRMKLCAGMIITILPLCYCGFPMWFGAVPDIRVQEGNSSRLFCWSVNMLLCKVVLVGFCSTYCTSLLLSDLFIFTHSHKIYHLVWIFYCLSSGTVWTMCSSRWEATAANVILWSCQIPSALARWQCMTSSRGTLLADGCGGFQQFSVLGEMLDHGNSRSYESVASTVHNEGSTSGYKKFIILPSSTQESQHCY